MPFMTHDRHLPPNARRESPTASESRARDWAGRILFALAILLLLMDGVMKVIPLRPVVDGMEQLGYPGGLARAIGIVILACLVLYVIPRTSVLGAILLTGFLGGAVASQVRAGNPLVSHVLTPVYLGLMLWGGLYLRDARLRALTPFRGTTS